MSVGDDERERRRTHHIDMPLGARLRLARDAFPLTREKLAEYLDVSVATIQRYENGGQRIPAARLWQICRRLNIEVSALFAELPCHVGVADGVAEPQIPFDHEDGRTKSMTALNKAAAKLSTDRLEIAVEIVRALKPGNGQART